MNSTLRGYEVEATDLVPRFEAVSTAELYAPLAHLLPEESIQAWNRAAGVTWTWLILSPDNEELATAK